MSFTDPYLYPHPHVLRNKAEIYDVQALRDFEYEQTEVRIDELHEHPIEGKFDLNHLKAIHAHIFQDISSPTAASCPGRNKEEKIYHDNVDVVRLSKRHTNTEEEILI